MSATANIKARNAKLDDAVIAIVSEREKDGIPLTNDPLEQTIILGMVIRRLFGTENTSDETQLSRLYKEYGNDSLDRIYYMLEILA